MSDYLEVLAAASAEVLEHSQADIAFYLAGVDVAAGDRYGKLALTEEGIRRRDRVGHRERARPRQSRS